MFGLFGELIRRHDAVGEAIIGTAAADRPPEFGRMVGMLVNTLPVRCPLEPGWTSRQLAVQTLDRLFDALDHGTAPIQEIVRATGTSSGALDNPLFRSMFSMNDAGLPDLTLPGLDVAFDEGINRTTSRTADIDVVLLPGVRELGADGNGALCIWDYSTEFFDEAAITLLAERWLQLLEAAAQAPDTPVSQLSLAGPADRPVSSPAPSRAHRTEPSCWPRSASTPVGRSSGDAVGRANHRLSQPGGSGR